MKESFAVDLVVDMLGGGKSSKLYKDLVLDKDVAVSVNAYYHGLTFSNGFVDVSVNPKSGIDLDIVEKELEDSIKNFVSAKITDEELKNTKYKYKAARFDNLSSLVYIAHFYAAHLALNVPLDEIDISYSQVNDVSLEDVNNKVRAIFSANKLIGRLLPKGDVNNENE